MADPDCRHRRERSLWAVRKKVMALDYVLAHRGERCLATAAQKLEYFQGELGLHPASFPSKAYRRDRSARLTRRYFVDRFPIHLTSDEGCPPPVVSFCYIDDGLSLSGFKTYLTQYENLLAALGRFHVAFASPGEYRRPRAERLFQAFAASLRGRRAEIVDNLQSRLLEYFRVRNALERKDYRGITTDHLDRFRNLRAELESAEVDADYTVWKHGGENATRCLWTKHGPTEAPFESSFSFSHLNHDYEHFFGV
jgi:hypothetical protein